MLIKTITTYNGSHGLFVAGRFYNIQKPVLEAIDAEVAAKRLPVFLYKIVKSTKNRPAKARKSKDAESEKGKGAGPAATKTGGKSKR